MPVPGILLLVPGSVGFPSLTSVIERQPAGGIERMFSMVLTVVAPVPGLLIAGVMVPEPRIAATRATPAPQRTDPTGG